MAGSEKAEKASQGLSAMSWVVLNGPRGVLGRFREALASLAIIQKTLKYRLAVFLILCFDQQSYVFSILRKIKLLKRHSGAHSWIPGAQLSAFY